VRKSPLLMQQQGARMIFFRLKAGSKVVLFSIQAIPGYIPAYPVEVSEISTD